MTKDLIRLSWPLERLGEALEALSGSTHSAYLPSDLDPNDDEALGSWISSNADQLNLEAQPIFASYAELEKVICAIGPALIRLRVGNDVRFLALLANGCLLDTSLRK